MKKIAFILLLVMFVSSLASCKRESAVLDESKTYSVSSEIHSLEINLISANVLIKHADKIYVESNLKHLEVSESNGVLKIKDNSEDNSKFDDAVFTLYIPADIVFENVDISTGAAKLTADALSAKSLELKLGAGDVRFKQLNVSSKTDIEGGTGQISILDGELTNLTLKMGYGSMNLTASLLGNSDLELGVGQSNITLLGNRDDYYVKGSGLIYVDGEKITGDCNIGSGKNKIEILGGIGAINIVFK